jgi:hypothetical protein
MSSPRGMAQIGPPRKGKAKLVFRDGVAHFPDPEAEIWEAIKNMRRDAQQAIIAEGGNPKQTARLILDKESAGLCDRAYFAAILHEQLARAENCLGVLLTCPAKDARWQGLRFAREMDVSRFFWQRLRLVESEKFTVTGFATSDAGKKGNEAKRLAAQRTAKQVRAFFKGRAIPRGGMEAAVREAMAKFRLGRAQIFAIKKGVQQRPVLD